MQRLCMIAGCERPHKGRGLCDAHRKREAYVRSPRSYHGPLRLRFERQVVRRPDGCWEWGTLTADGYRRVFGDGHHRRTHRVVYELLVGPIPDGLQIDYLCRNRGCCNPEHLEPVTQVENVRRGWIARREKANA